MNEKTEVHNSAHSLYEKLESKREPFLIRARECSKYTIPTLMPLLGHTSTTEFATPWQGMGARGVNNLSSKLLLALFPPNSPFFKLQIDDFTLEELTKQEGMRAQVEEGLNKIERSVQNEIERGAVRVSGFEAIKHLVVGGNVLQIDRLIVAVEHAAFGLVLLHRSIEHLINVDAVQDMQVSRVVMPVSKAPRHRVGRIVVALC